jgi:predicted 2-oxoglutarate/Fe(II)-dependent dioxygenase YbiX
MNDSFKGGEFYLEKEHIPFGLGEMIKFDGNTKHSVNRVTEGNREVLAVWINRIPKHNKSVI